jgi:hypothetical protein
MQTCNRIYYSKTYWRLSMFRAASVAPNCICRLWFIYSVPTQPGQRPVTTWAVYKPEAANTVWSSWWWAVCRSKHAEPSVSFGIINSIIRLHLVGYFYWCIQLDLPPDKVLHVSDRSYWLSTIIYIYINTARSAGIIVIDRTIEWTFSRHAFLESLW